MGQRRLLLLFLICAVYATGMRAGFAVDNALIIRGDPRVQRMTLRTVGRIFTEPYFPDSGFLLDRYRPLTTLSYQLNARISREAWAFIGVNLLIHWLNALLIMGLAGRFLAPGGALAVAALFAVHPLGVECVTNIVGRADLLATLLMLLGLRAHLRGRHWLVLICGLAAPMCKESGVMLAGVMLAWNLSFGGWNWRGYAALIPGILAMIAARWLVLNHDPVFTQIAADDPLAVAAPLDRLRLALSALGRYVGLILWPGTLSCDYSMAYLPSPAWLACLPIPLALMHHRASIFFTLAACAAVLPVSNLLMPVGAILAERFMYLPVACAAFVLLSRFNPPRLAIAAVVLALSMRTALRNLDWRDDLTIWSAAAQAHPESYKPHQELAALMLESGGDPRRAAEEADRAVAIVRRLPLEQRITRPYAILALALNRIGDPAGAIQIADEGIRIDQVQCAILNQARRARSLPPVDLLDLQLHQIRRRLRIP